MTKFEVFSVPYFPVLSLNAGKNGPEKIPYLGTFQAVENLGFYLISLLQHFCRVVFRSERCQTSKKELYANIVKDWNPLTIFAKTSILHV